MLCSALYYIDVFFPLLMTSSALLPSNVHTSATAGFRMRIYVIDISLSFSPTVTL